jgi:choline dehydrogenase
MIFSPRASGILALSKSIYLFITCNISFIIAKAQLIAVGLICTVSLAVAQPNLQYSNSFGRLGYNATFDYIVVGGGTAGLAIAYRLAEDGINTVAVVEAGGFYEQENGNTSVVPTYNQEYNYVTPDSQWDAPLVDWGFLTESQACAMRQRFHYGRGKMLGGW